MTKDRYLFRVGEVVVGVNDIQLAHEDLTALQCRFPDALMEIWSSENFRGKWKKVNEKLSALETPLGEDQNSIIFLASMRQLWKLSVYVEGQSVVIAPELEKASQRAGGCPSVEISPGKMRDSFRKWLQVEVYLRSRYAPGGMTATQEWREKRLQSIAQFVDSLDKQLSHENFW